MACGVYSPNEYEYGIQKESTLGTAVITDGGSETMIALDFIGIPDMTPGVYRSQNVHNSEGRTAKIGDMKTEPKLNENSVSGTIYVDETTIKYLVENLFANAVGTSPASFDVPWNFSNGVCLGDTDTDWTGAMTFVKKSPITSESEIYPGMVVDTLSIYADTEDEAGRFKADVSWKSRIVPNLTADGSSWTVTSYPVDEARYIYDLGGASAVRTIESIDFVMSSFRCEMNSQIKFYGFDTDGDMEEIARGIPELMVNYDIGMKIDSDTKAFKDYILTQDTLDLEVYNAAWASATFGFRSDYCTVRDNFGMEEVQDGAFFTLPLKATASTSGDMIQIVL